MQKLSTTAKLLAACFGVSLGSSAPAAVIINEVLYDDVGTDDREFVELYNNGVAAVDISGWVLLGRDATTVNPSATVPAATSLAPGAYYVFGNTTVLNVNQVVGANQFENDVESVELNDSGGTLMDAVAYETNKGAVYFTPPVGLAGQLGPGVFGNSQAGVDLAGTPLNGNTSIGRFVNGRDTNNNGRDWGLRPSTPGTSNAPGGTMVAYAPPNPAALTVGSDMPGMTATFVNPRVIDVTVVDTNNLNAISPPPGTGSNKAYTVFDPSGGGNGATTNAVFSTGVSSFAIKAYFDTNDLPVQSNAAGTQFRGSEVTVYGIGGGDGFNNLTDLTGAVGITASTLPAADNANGHTGIAWVYEKTGITPAGGPVSEKLHLVDANDGGDSQAGGNTPLDWTIITTIDMTLIASGWHDLSISIDALGNGVATFDTQVVNFLTAADLVGAFNAAYRENLQIGADGTPDAIMRPATFTVVPEPASLAMLGLAGAMALRRSRRA